MVWCSFPEDLLELPPRFRRTSYLELVSDIFVSNSPHAQAQAISTALYRDTALLRPPYWGPPPVSDICRNGHGVCWMLKGRENTPQTNYNINSLIIQERAGPAQRKRFRVSYVFLYVSLPLYSLLGTRRLPPQTRSCCSGTPLPHWGTPAVDVTTAASTRKKELWGMPIALGMIMRTTKDRQHASKPDLLRDAPPTTKSSSCQNDTLVWFYEQNTHVLVTSSMAVFFQRQLVLRHGLAALAAPSVICSSQHSYKIILPVQPVEYCQYIPDQGSSLATPQ